MLTENFPSAAHGTGLAAVLCGAFPRRGHGRQLATRRREKEQLMSIEENKAAVGRW
jgi:hypothetical protein